MFLAEFPLRWMGCTIEGGRRLFLGGLPLRWAARLREGGVCFWGGSRCAGLLDWGGGRRLFLRELPLRGLRARGCSVEGEREVFLAEFPLRWAARLKGGGGCFWEGSPCAGLLD